MFGKVKLLNIYTQSNLYIALILSLSLSAIADDQVKGIKTVVSSLKDIGPSNPTDCPTSEMKTKIKRTEESLTSRLADTLFAFVESKDNTNPVQFFLYSRVGINTDGSPKYSPIKNRKSNVRVLDSFLRGQTSNNKNLLGLSESELDNFFTSNTTLSAPEREDTKIILEMTKHSKESDILNTLKEMTKGFSYKRKLQVLASVGNNLLGGYDKSRTQDDKKSFKGVVTTEDMFSAMRRSLINGDKIDAGVCRDMHLSMAKMARAMGIKNAYGVGYATRASGHLILTTTPDSYGTVSTVNYNRIEHSKGVTGAGALELQGGMPNWGTAMYISNGENNTEVLAIPTRLGQALSVASGGEVDSLLFGAQDNGNVLRAGAKTKFGNIIYSHQELSDGTPGKVSGLFYQLDKSIFSFINFNGAIGYIESEREAGNENLYESGMYVRTSTRIGDHIPLTKKLSIYPFATHHYSYLSSCRRTDSNPDCVENDKTISTEKRIRQNTYTSNIIAGTGLYFRDTHLKANIAYKFRMQNLLDDARDANSPRNYRPSQHQFSMNAEHLSDHFNIGGSAKLVLSDLKDQVVKTYQASGHITYLPIGISLLGEATGRFDSAGRVVPAWLPGSENRQTYRLTKSFESIGNNLGIEYQRSDDFPELNSGFFIFRLGDE